MLHMLCVSRIQRKPKMVRPASDVLIDFLEHGQIAVAHRFATVTLAASPTGSI